MSRNFNFFFFNASDGICKSNFYGMSSLLMQIPSPYSLWMLNREHCLCRSWIALVLPQGLYLIYPYLMECNLIIINLNTFCSIAGSLGAPVLNGSAPNPQALSLPVNGQAAVSGPALPAQAIPTPAAEPVGTPSECLLLKNMFDPATEVSGFLLLFSTPS